MSNRISVAIIGCGWAGQRHAQALSQAGAQIRWAVDTQKERAEQLAQRYGAEPATDYHLPLADKTTQAVCICLPHYLHAPVTLEALQVGKHVLVEKPLATSLDEADAMIATAERSQRILMVAENVRFDPLCQRVATLLREKIIGRPALIQITRQCYLVRSFLQERPWFLEAKKAAGGIMMAGGIHDMEKIRMLLGEILSVQALRAPQRFLEMEGDDTSVALVRLRNGAIGILVESFIMKSLTTATGREIHTLRIDGQWGSLEVSEPQRIRLYSEKTAWQHKDKLLQWELYVPPADTFLRIAKHLLHCIQTGEEPLTSGRSQRRPLEAVLAAYRSMAQDGIPVALSPPTSEDQP